MIINLSGRQHGTKRLKNSRKLLSKVDIFTSPCITNTIYVPIQKILGGDQVITGKDIKQIIKNINKDIKSYIGNMFRVTFDLILEDNKP